jgi:hypothetical protein
MPRLVEDKRQKVYGKVPFQLPLYTMEAVENHVLRNTVQQYDSGAPLNHDTFQQDLIDPNYFQGAMEMSFSDGLRGNSVVIPPDSFVGPAFELRPDLARAVAQSDAMVLRARAESARAMEQVYPNEAAQYAKMATGFSDKAATLGDVFEDELTDPAYWDQTMEQGRGLGDMGVARRPLTPPPQSKVTMPVPEPVRSSTVMAVVGVSVLAVVGSIAAWAYFRKKK